ncbi:hypothetical protein GCM10010468_23080 [Actinocorallia longicatena]|uniref:Secreted protein n=1 Tax=Actinocorallia longicatena TaxID=111803 RepID=A0ABP6Q7K3_9ACTN
MRAVVAAVVLVGSAPPAAVHAAAAPAPLRDVPLPFLWPRAEVSSVAAVSGTEAWVTGGQGRVGGSAGNPVVRHRVGSQWKEYPLGGWSGNGYVSQVVAHGGEVWVRGLQDPAGTARLYLARFDGTAFRPVAPPAEIASAHDVALWGGPAGVWIRVGVEAGENEIRPALFRRTGGSWTADPVVERLNLGGLSDLQAVSATEAWAGACRWNAVIGALESVTLRWDGSTWTTLPPLPSEGCDTSVAPAGGGTAWTLTWNATLHHWNGTSWTTAPAGPFSTNGKKVRLDGDGNPLVTVNNAIIYGLAPLLRYADGQWQTFPTPVTTWTSDFSVAPGGRIWVAGATRIDSPVFLTSP